MDLIFINNVAINEKRIEKTTFHCIPVLEVDRWYDANNVEHNDVVRKRYEAEFQIPGVMSQAELDEFTDWLKTGITGAEIELSAVYCPEEKQYVTFVARKPSFIPQILKSTSNGNTYNGFKVEFVGV